MEPKINNRYMIERHSSDLVKGYETKEHIYNRVYPVVTEHIHSNPEILGTQTTEALAMFAFSETNHKPKDSTILFLRRGRDYGIANFMYGSNPGLEFEFVIDDTTYHLVGNKASAYMHSALWIKTFYACLITRTQNGIQQLLKTPNEVFLNANIKANSFDIAFVNLLKGLFDSSANMGDLFQKILATSDPEVLEIERQNYIYDISIPITKLIHDLLRNDEEGFNQELQAALEAHKKFWSKGREVDNYRGWVSLPLLAICALAVDHKNFTITVESEYIPKWLYEKDF